MMKIKHCDYIDDKNQILIIARILLMKTNLCKIRIHVIATHITAEMKEDVTESSENDKNYSFALISKKRFVDPPSPRAKSIPC